MNQDYDEEILKQIKSIACDNLELDYENEEGMNSCRESYLIPKNEVKIDDNDAVSMKFPESSEYELICDNKCTICLCVVNLPGMICPKCSHVLCIGCFNIVPR